MTSDWSRWLDRLETSISAQRAAIVEGRHDDVVPGPAPVALGPLPTDLEERARQLLDHNASLTRELAAACAAHGRQLKLLSTIAPHGSSASSFLDTHT